MMPRLRTLAGAFDLRDGLAAAGLGCIAYGTWQWSPPAAWIVVGTLLLALAIASSWKRNHGPARPPAEPN